MSKKKKGPAGNAAENDGGVKKKKGCKPIDVSQISADTETIVFNGSTVYSLQVNHKNPPLLVDIQYKKIVGRICRVCGKPKVLSEFSPNHQCLGGTEATCKECKRPRLRAKYHEAKKRISGKPDQDASPIKMISPENKVLASRKIRERNDKNPIDSYKKPVEDSFVSMMAAYSEAVSEHIESYTIAQYKDYPNDNATAYTPAECVWQIRKYVTRFGSGARPGEEARDMLKVGHYCCISVAKILGDRLQPIYAPRTPVGRQSYRVREWHGYMSFLTADTAIDQIYFDVMADARSYPNDPSLPMHVIVDDLLATGDATAAPGRVGKFIALTLHAARIWTLLQGKTAAARRWDSVDVKPKCRICGCTDDDCRQCIELTGQPCFWVAPDLCSACADKHSVRMDNVDFPSADHGLGMTGPIHSTIESIGSDKTLMLDFSNYPQILEAISDLAAAQFRTPELQALYLLCTGQQIPEASADWRKLV